jgi:uncharacterized protein YjeT (DUF2065 family)
VCELAKGYEAGVCNIGPAEIKRRFRIGHVGLAVTVLVFVGLIVGGVPRPWRLLGAIPATLTAAGYIQAKLRFCANFGFRGVFNFGPPGSVEQVAYEEARAADRRKAYRIGLGSLGIGVAVALISLPW